MKRPSFLHGAAVALLASFSGGVLFSVLSGPLPSELVLRAVIALLGLVYTLYLLIHSDERVGRVTTVLLWSVMFTVSWLGAPSSPARTLVKTVPRVSQRVLPSATRPRQPTPVSLDHRIRQPVGHAIQVGRLQPVLEARQRRLRGQRLSMDRIPTQQQLVHRILCQLARVIGVGVAQRDREDSLLQQLLERVRHLPRLPRILQAFRQRLRQPEPLVDALEQHAAPIRDAVLLAKLHGDRLRSQVGKTNTLCGRIVTHEEAPVVRKRV